MRAVASRRLVLTHSGLLERRPADYEVADWRQLAAIAAVVRYAEDPQWLSIEWADGAPTSTYVTPARDALLAAVVDAAQAAAGRPIPVLAQRTAAGEAIVARRGQAAGAPAVIPDAEMEKLCLGHLTASARDFLSAGGASASLAALTLSSLTAQAGGSRSAAAEARGDLAESLLLPASAGDSGGSDAGSEPGSPRGSSRGSAVRRAFARGAPAGAGAKAGGSSADAYATFQQRVREFNASVAYSGVSIAARADDAVVAALLAHLPRQLPPQQAGGTGQPAMAADEARLVVAALQALQRLAGSVPVADRIVGSGGGAGRVFAALQSGHDHVAAEAARLLLRLFAPAAARAGAGPWTTAAGAGSDGAAANPLAVNSPEEESAARAAKSVCFISRSRCAALVSVLRGRAAPAGPLLAMAVAEAAAAVACEPGSQVGGRAGGQR